MPEAVQRSHRVEIDHIFLFTRDEAQARTMMQEAGLVVNYSRVHPGQGTTNVCACLEDMFLELLWLDGSAISAESERITLGLRGRGEGSPIGISWRGDDHDLATEPYAAPFLPAGMTIPVSPASLDPKQPFVFKTPGGTPPSLRNDDLAGNRQLPRFAGLANCTISAPNPDECARMLAPFEDVQVVAGPDGMRFTLIDPEGHECREVAWQV